MLHVCSPIEVDDKGRQVSGFNIKEVVQSTAYACPL